MKRKIVHPNLQKTEVIIREVVDDNGKTEEIEKKVLIPTVALAEENNTNNLDENQ